MIWLTPKKSRSVITIREPNDFLVTLDSSPLRVQIHGVGTLLPHAKAGGARPRQSFHPGVPLLSPESGELKYQVELAMHLNRFLWELKNHGRQKQRKQHLSEWDEVIRQLLWPHRDLAQGQRVQEGPGRGDMLRSYLCSNNRCQKVIKYARAWKQITEITEIVESRGWTEKILA